MRLTITNIHRSFPVAAIIFCFCFAVTAKNAYPAQKGKDGQIRAAGGVSIDADNISSKKATQEVSASGKVVIKYDDKVISGDRAKYNLKTGDGEVWGNVVFKDNEAEIKCDSVEFNYNTGLGKMSNATINFKEKYFISAKEIERPAKNKFKVANGKLTTCTEKKPHWQLGSGSVDLTLEGYAFLKGMTFRILDTPVFYLPYFIAPAKNKRATGFLIPSIGQSSKNGIQVTQSFFWAVAENMDATLTYGYLGEKGNKYKGEARYIFAPGTHGNLDAELIRETDPERENDRDLWRVRYDHRQLLPWGVNGVAHLDVESEDSISREYGDDVSASTRRYNDSFLHLYKSWPTRALSFMLREQKSTQQDTEDTISRYPEISLVNQSERLWGSPLYGSFRSSYVGYKTDSVVNDASNPFDVERVDFFPVIKLPVSVAPWLSLTPSLGARYTWYSNGLDESGEQLNESFIREYYTAGLAVTGPRFFRIFETGSKKRPRAKHLITPVISWSYAPGYEFDGEDRQKVKVLDGVDYSAPANTINFQLLNQVLVKETLGPESSRTVEAVRFSVSQSYNIREATRNDDSGVEKRPFSSILLDLDTKIVPWLMVNYDIKYNIYDAVWESSNLEIGFRYENAFHLALDRRVKYQGKDLEDLIWDTAYVEINTPWNLSIDYSLIYNETENEMTNNIFRIRYRDDCWGAGFNWYQRKVSVVTDSGQTELQDETGFLFTITLKGLGDIMGGEKPSLARRKL